MAISAAAASERRGASVDGADAPSAATTKIHDTATRKETQNRAVLLGFDRGKIAAGRRMAHRMECSQLGQLHALADGELTKGAADEMRGHLAICAACQSELAELLRLDAMIADHESRRCPVAGPGRDSAIGWPPRRPGSSM
jgi:hypothetical protein